jgi:phosphoserine phosphatase
MNLCKEIWRKADAVCFDVDSTVCCDEAIDELAKYVNKTKEVSEITKSAMLGGANFRDALAKRLDIIRPDRRILVQYLKKHEPRLTPYIEELVARLHDLGRDVYLISGGFDVIIKPAAEILNIPMENVFANSLKFYFDGSYAGFDESRPTSNQDGKSRVISMLKQSKGYKNVVMIGDGVTDLEACPPADAFIGFGGNQIRETVRDNCDWFVHSFKELLVALP